MKFRIDRVYKDTQGQIVVFYTFAPTGDLPVNPSKQCLAFPNKAALVAALRDASDATIIDALRAAVIEWRKSDATLSNLTAAAGKIGDIDAQRGSI